MLKHPAGQGIARSPCALAPDLAYLEGEAVAASGDALP